MSDDRTRRTVLSVCAVLALALLLVLGRIAVAGWAPSDDAPRERRGPVVPREVPGQGRGEEVRRAATERAGVTPGGTGAGAAGLRGNPAAFFGPDAYPPEAIRAGEQGRTVAQLAVGADGIPTGCAIATSSGSRSLDAATCAIAIGRVRYVPAHDTAGRPIAARVTLPVRWVLP